jgi:hypothetical protein
MGGETKAGVSSYKVSTGNTDTVSRKSALRSVTQGLGNDVWDMLYNSSGQPHIPPRHPGSFPQYTSAGRITKSAEEPGCRGGVCGHARLSSVHTKAQAAGAMGIPLDLSKHALAAQLAPQRMRGQTGPTHGFHQCGISRWREIRNR